MGGNSAKNRDEAMVFIDGNNFYHNIKGMKIKPGNVDFLKLSEYVCSFFSSRRKETVYYNSVPSIKDGKKLYYSHMKFLDGLKKLPRFTVKTRKLQRSSTEEVQKEKKDILEGLNLCDKCEPIIRKTCMDCVGNIKKREKGIDIMIGIDMLEVAIKDKCNRCILISGDSDFVPALKLIEKNGKKVCTAFVPKGYAYELRDKFDYFLIGRNDIMSNCFK